MFGSGAPGRNPLVLQPVGNTAMAMNAAGSIQVPAGRIARFVIRYGGDLVFDLAFEKGWNLVSLPIEPPVTAVATVLASDGAAAPIHEGAVLIWNGTDYVETEDMHAGIGYWVHAGEPSVLLVKGSPAPQDLLPLLQGWNLIGPAQVCPLPNDDRIRGPALFWNSALLRYQPVDSLIPGWGYWINASEDADIPLGVR
jgi:hypothetical protein